MKARSRKLFHPVALRPADPNKLVAITDQVNATSAPSGESFQTVQSAGSGQVLRGVSVTPGTRTFGR